MRAWNRSAGRDSSKPNTPSEPVKGKTLTAKFAKKGREDREEELLLMPGNRTRLSPSFLIFVLAAFLTGCGGSGTSIERSFPGTSGQFTHVYVVFPPATGMNNAHFIRTVMTQQAID